MKTRPPRALYKASKPEKKRYEQGHLKEIKAALRRPLVTHSPFDWTERTRQAEEAQRARDLLVRLRSKYAEANELLPAVGDRYAAAIRAAYPPGFWENYESLRAGQPVELDPYIEFLETDPWFHRTGYEKADIIRAINRRDLTEREKARLRDVVIQAVDSRDRREFRSYCRLARKVDDPSLRAALIERLENEDRGVRRRARWVLEALSVLPPEPREGWIARARRMLASDNEMKRELARAILRGEGWESLAATSNGDNDES